MMDAVMWAAKCYCWAQGHSDFKFGVFWPFNPLMLVNGVPAYRVAAAELGGAFADVAARMDADAIKEAA
jgi:hypothetical protein